MSTCVYCRGSRPGRFPREHVVPKSFGSFRHNLTLGCVCGDCNLYFSKQLELQFARESAESIVRFQHGLRDEVAGNPNSRLTARVNVPGPMFGAKVLLYPNATRNGIEIVYAPQVAFQTKNSEEWKWYAEEDLNSEVLRTLEQGSQVKYLFTSPAEEERLRSRLSELGLPSGKPVRRDAISPQPELRTRVRCHFDSNIARCVAKIAFNYLAYVLGEDLRLLLRGEFDGVRNYVRLGSNPEKPVVYFSESPKLEKKEREGSLVDGHILTVGWDATNENLVCGLSLFNAMTYRVLLCHKYGGVWFSLNSTHLFDFQTNEAKKSPLSLGPAAILWG